MLSSSSPFSSITDDEESQSLRQSSGAIGGRIGCGILGSFATVTEAVADVLGPLCDSSVLLIPLEVGLRMSKSFWNQTTGPDPLSAARKQGWLVGFIGEREGEIGKFVFALGPRRFPAAISYALAACSAESKVPSQIRVFFNGSLISAAYLPDGLFLTPLNLICRDPSSALGNGAPAAVVLPRRMVFIREDGWMDGDCGRERFDSEDAHERLGSSTKTRIYFRQRGKRQKAKEKDKKLKQSSLFCVCEFLSFASPLALLPPLSL